MDKKTNYMPQFEYNIDDECEYRYNNKCEKCGETATSIIDGVCFDCRQKFTAQKSNYFGVSSIYINSEHTNRNFTNQIKNSKETNYIYNFPLVNSVSKSNPLKQINMPEQPLKNKFSIRIFLKKNYKYFLYSLVVLLILAAVVTPFAKSAYESKLEKEQAANAPETISVYITKSGNCYHRNTCSYLRYSKIEISLDKAEEKNYRACSRCNPPITD